MRTTIRIDDQLLREAKRIALERQSTLTEVIEDSLRETFARRKSAAGRERIVLPTFRGNGLRPGVSIECYGATLDLMDAYDAMNPADADSGR